MKWEYKNIYRHRTISSPDDNNYRVTTAWTPDIEAEIATLGDDGWELVTIVPRSSVGGELHYTAIGEGDVYAVLTKGSIISGVTTEEVWWFKRPKP